MDDEELKQQIDAYVARVWDDVVDDIGALVAVRSVEDPAAAAPGAPWGPESRRALDTALGIAERLGLATHDCAGYLGYADLPGASETQIATIAHTDIVPEGTGWSFEPFALTRKDGYLIGRGVLDDKGPCVLSLYAARFFKEKGETLPYTLRCIIGNAEETSMDDVAYYLEHYPEPAFLFSPDAEFPVCCGEKGIMSAVISSKEIAGGRIVELSGGTVENAIPGLAQAVVKADAEALEPWGPIDAAAGDASGDCATADDASGDCATSDGTAAGSVEVAAAGGAGSVEVAVAGGAGSVEVAVAGEGLVRLTAHGIGGHASKPAGTLNAIGVLVDYLLDHDLCDEAERRFLEFEELVFASTDGSSLGIDAADEAFGPLTCIGGVVRTVEGRFEQTIDVRYPTTIDGARIERTLVFLAAAHRCAFAIDHDMAPFYSDPSAPDIRVLTACYCEYAQREAEPYTIGGGTYARHFAHAASFGPVDPTLLKAEWVGSEHTPDEGIEEEQLKRALKIYILAIARLMRIER